MQKYNDTEYFEYEIDYINHPIHLERMVKSLVIKEKLKNKEQRRKWKKEVWKKKS